MGFIVEDRVKETSATAGSGALTLAGAVAKFRAFSAVCANGDTVPYLIESPTDWEVGIGTWGTGNILTRTTVLRSSNSNAAVVFSGALTVYLSALGSQWGQFGRTHGTLGAGFSATVKADEIYSPASAASHIPIALFGQITYTGTGGFTSGGHMVGALGFSKWNAPGVSSVGLVIGVEGKVENQAGTITQGIGSEGQLSLNVLGQTVTNFYGHNSSITSNAGTVGSFIGFSLGVSNNSGSITDVYHSSMPAPNGAVTNCFGYHMADTTGTALNIAFYSQLTASSTKYAIYCPGGAQSYIAGKVTFVNRVLLAQGAVVASANNLTLGLDGNQFPISGTTQINLLEVTDWQAGAEVTLLFQGVTTVKHAQVVSGNFKPFELVGARDFITQAKSILTLRYDGTVWQEICRNWGDTNPIPMAAIAVDPAAPAASNLLIYAKDYAGRMMPKWVGPSAVDVPFQASIGFNRVGILGPLTGATITNTVISTPTIVGTLSNPAMANTNYRTTVRRVNLITAVTTAGTLCSIRSAMAEVWRGDATGRGGFFVMMRVGLTTLAAGNRGFFGICDVLTAPTNVDPLTSTTPGKMGIAFAANTGNWSFVTNLTGSAPTATALGANFPVNVTDMLELILFCPPNGTTIGWRVKNLASNLATSGSVTTNYPTNTTFLGLVNWMTNNATAANVSFDFSRWYLESDD